MQILAITGANGFLGINLVHECIRRNINLRLLVRNKDLIKKIVNDGTVIFEGDLLEPDILNNIFIPHITFIHLAYIPNDEALNIKLTLNIIEAVKKYNIKKVIYCSTATVVGFDDRGIITENTIPKPKGEYQKTKYKIEELFRNRLPANVELGILRPTEIIGPGGIGLKSMINRIRFQNEFVNYIYHYALKYRCFNYVSVYNVVEAVILLATTQVKLFKETYNISDDDDLDNNYGAIEKIINEIIKNDREYILNYGLPKKLLSFLFKLLPSHSPPNRIYSHVKICNLGYNKVISLKSAVSELVECEINNAHS